MLQIVILFNDVALTALVDRKDHDVENRISWFVLVFVVSLE